MLYQLSYSRAAANVTENPGPCPGPSRHFKPGARLSGDRGGEFAASSDPKERPHGAQRLSHVGLERTPTLREKRRDGSSPAASYGHK